MVDTLTCKNVVKINSIKRTHDLCEFQAVIGVLEGFNVSRLVFRWV